MSLGPMAILDTYPVPRQTQTAGTPIVGLVPPRKWSKTKVTFIQYTSGATAHTITNIREKARCKAAVAAAGGATSLIVDRDPGSYSTDPTMGGSMGGTPVAGVPLGRGITPSTANNLIAANDYIVVTMADGSWFVTLVSAAVTDSTTGRVTLTVSALPNAGVNVGATVWFMGAPGDTCPLDNMADGQLKPGTSATTVFPNAAGAGGALIAQSPRMESPILIYSDNPTAAGVLDAASANYGT